MPRRCSASSIAAFSQKVPVRAFLLLLATLLFLGTHAQGESDTIYKSHIFNFGEEASEEKAYTATELLAIATESQTEWNKAKVLYQDSYSYEYKFASWAGFGTNYTVVVSTGTVVRFITKSWRRDQSTGDLIIDPEVIMEGDDIDPSKAFTIDELYELCINDWLPRGETDHYLYLGLSDAGLLTMCGYVHKQCADDCYNGIQHFKAFSWDKKEDPVTMSQNNETDPTAQSSIDGASAGSMGQPLGVSFLRWILNAFLVLAFCLWN